MQAVVESYRLQALVEMIAEPEQVMLEMIAEMKTGQTIKDQTCMQNKQTNKQTTKQICVANLHAS